MLLKVFVYGTLKPGEANYQYYCAGKVIEATRAYALGQLFHLPPGYPAMTPGNSRVEGFLLTLADSAVLEILDELEGYHPQRSPQENQYYRQKILVYNLSGKPLGKAWGYFMTSEQVRQLGGILLPSGWWSDAPTLP
ncbi:MAG: gamma-glutamylcyclotransferase [Xenococcaceae cyanobacterium]